MRSGRLGAYAAWQLRDYALNRGVPTLIIGALFLLQLSLVARAGAGIAGDALLPIVSSMLGPFVLVGALIAINGLISHDRRGGHFRFLFAKPVSIPRYYVQAFLIHGAGFVAATGVFLLAVWMVADVAPPARTVLHAAVYYALLGGLGFLFSAALRSDWVLLAATLVLTQLARSQWSDAPEPFGWIVRWGLPPFHLLDDVRAALIGGAIPDWWLVVWPITYGSLAVVAGLVVLRRRPLAA